MEGSVSGNERIDDLQYKGLKIIQKKNGFCFGVDSIIIVNFADIPKASKVLDIGSGSGIISVLIAAKTEASSVTGVEIQSEMAEMAKRSIRMNCLEHKVEVINEDIKQYTKYTRPSSFDAVVTNPPYIPNGGGIINSSDSKAIAKHEIACSLDDIVEASARLLKSCGQLTMIHRVERMTDVFYTMRCKNIEPKFLRMVQPDVNKAPNLFMVKGTKGGNSGIKVFNPLYIYNQDGSYSDEINRIYCR